MFYLDLPEKEKIKSDKELVELHKKCITDYLVQRSMKLRKRRKFFIIYDFYIDEKNIKEYFFRPIRLFVYALVTNRLSEIQDYIPKPKENGKTKKKNTRR